MATAKHVALYFRSAAAQRLAQPDAPPTGATEQRNDGA